VKYYLPASLILATLLLLHWPQTSTLAQRNSEPSQGPTADQAQLVVQLGHSTSIASIRFSYDDRFILTAGDRTGRLWDTSTGKELLRFLGHKDWVTSATFSPDGRMILTGSADKTARLWDAQTGRELRRFNGHGAGIRSVAFSPNGRLLVTGGGLFEKDDNTARVWDTGTGRLLLRLRGHTSRVNSVAFSPNSHLILTASDDGTARLWNATTGREVRHFLPSAGRLNAAALSPDGRFVLIGCEKKVAQLWDIVTGRRIRSLTGHTEEVTSVTFSPNGSYALTGSDDRTARLWEVPTGVEVRRFVGQPTGISAVAFSHDGQFVATGGGNAEKDNIVILWSAATGKVVRSLEGQASYLSATRFSPDGRFVLTGNGDKVGHLWDLSTGQEVQRFVGHTELVRAVAFSPDGTSVLTGSGEYWGQDFTARLWDITTGREIRRFDGHMKPVEDVAFSPDGSMIATASSDSTVRLWSAATGKVVRQFEGDPAGMYTVAFSRDGHALLAGGFNSTYMWRVETGEVMRRLESGLHASLSPDGRYVLTGNILWDVSTGREVRRFGTDDELGTTAAAFSPDGRSILFAGDQGPSMWDVATGREIRRLVGHTDSVYSADYSPDGSLIVTGGRDGTSRIWRASTGQELLRLISFRDGTWAAIDVRGRFDTNDLEAIGGLQWMMPDDPLHLLPLEIFMRDYYEPRLVPRILAGEPFKPIRDLKTLNRFQPGVRIVKIEPQGGTPDTVSVEVEVTEAASRPQMGRERAGVYDLRLFRDRQLVGLLPDRGGRIKIDPQSSREVVRFDNIKLPRAGRVAQVEFSAYAFNSDRVKSATDRKRFDIPEHPEGVRGRAYLVTVGINTYESPQVRGLLYPADDARLMRDTLSTKLRQTGSYEEVVTIPLIADFGPAAGESVIQPTKRNVRTVLELLAGNGVTPEEAREIPSGIRDQIKAATPDDLVLISFSTHGEADENGNFYLYPFDTGTVSDGEELRRHLISSDELSEWLRNVDAGELAMVLDACHSGAAPGTDFKPGPMGSRGLGQLAYDKGMRILAATQSDNVALGGGAVSFSGLLTTALIRDGIDRRAATRDGRLTIRHWMEYAVRRVPELYRELPPDEQSRQQVQQPALFDFNTKKADVIIAVMD